MSTSRALTPAPAFLQGGGAMGALMRGHDWAATPLGPPERWPAPLRHAVALLLQARQPMYLAWGPELVSLYNDGYIGILGDKHPHSLGQPAPQLWAEVWDWAGSVYASVLQGQAQWFEDQPLKLQGRQGVRTSYFNVSLTPLLDDEGRPVGVFVVATETTEKVLLGRHLADEASRQQRLFQQAPGFICTFRGPEHVFEFVNDAHVRLFGRTDLVGRPVREGFPELAGQGIFELMDRVWRTGERHVADGMPVRIRTGPHGLEQVFWVEFIFAPVRDANGRVTGIFCEGHDITSARRDRQALQAQEEHLRLATEAAEIGLWDVNMASGTMYWPPRIKAMFGIPPDAPVTMDDFFHGLHSEDREHTAQAYAAACDPAQRALYDVEYRAIGQEDGVERWVAARGRALFDDEGRCVRVLGTALDITARKRTEQDLLCSQARLQRMVQALTRLHDTTLRLGAGGEVPEVLDVVMQAALELTGADQGMLTLFDPARGDLELKASAGLPPAFLPLAARVPVGVGSCGVCFARRERVVVEDTDLDPITAPYRDAARIAGYRAAHSTPLTGMHGQVLGVLTLFHAQPGRPEEQEFRLAELLARSAASWLEQHQLLQALRDADSRKDEFLATLAHELRNPLAPIRNAVHLMAHAGKGRVDIGQLQQMLERQVNHMVRLVDDLMEASRISRGKIELRREQLDVADVLRAAIESSRPEIERMGHELRHVAPVQPLPVDGDPVRLSQIFINLLNNAAHYTERGGRIELAAWSEGGFACVRVRDNGIGIAPEQLPRLFEMFSQIDRRHSGAQAGLGIGLSLVQRLAQMHGGTVQAASRGLGHGSEFTVRLPLRAPAVAEFRPAYPLGTAALTVGRVLVVDDNRDAADSLALLLGTLGADARVAHDGASALALARDWRPQLVLLDLGMPGMDGYEVARRLRERSEGRGLTLAALTGWGQERDRRRTQAAEFDHHLVKPIEPATLRALLTAPPRANGLAATVRPPPAGA